MNFTNFTNKSQLLLQLLLYVSLTIFIIARYKKDVIFSDEDSRMSPEAFETTAAIIYGLFALTNIFLVKSNLTLSIVIFLSTIAIFFAAFINIKKSPLPEPDTTSVPDATVEQLRILNIDLHNLYKNKLLTKTLFTLGFFSIIVFILWLGIWKNNCTTSDLLCNHYFIFTMSYMAFALFIILDMFRNTQDRDYFHFFHDERNELLLNNSWIGYSIFYTLYLVYVLIMAQSIRNTINGTNMDMNFNFIGLIAFIMVLLQFYHYFQLLKAREECNCDQARVSILDNNIKVFQFNSLFLPIIICIISVLIPKTVPKL